MNMCCRCPTFDLEGLPWPDNSVPDAFKARGNADVNVPGAVHWMGVLQKVTISYEPFLLLLIIPVGG